MCVCFEAVSAVSSTHFIHVNYLIQPVNSFTTFVNNINKTCRFKLNEVESLICKTDLWSIYILAISGPKLWFW